MGKLRAIATDLALLLGSILVFLLVCEFVIFRFVWLASDAPWLDYVNGLVRYAPHQAGVWRIRDEIAAPFRINAQGWNSGIGDYAIGRRAGMARVALVGDSYVEAMQVAAGDSTGELLAHKLSQAGQPTEVYRFGISGAPLSQYVYMVEREAVSYRPDWIIVIVVHNEFDESFQFKQGRYTSSFMKFRVEDGKVIGELAPSPWRPGAIEVLRETATARFFLYRWQARPQAIVDLLLPRPAGAAENPDAANVEIDSILRQRREVAAVADHASARLAGLAAGIGARLLLVMDGDRYAIYRGDPSSPALELNRIMAAAAAKLSIGFLDLHPIFAAHWAAHHRRFDFDADGHWNELGHSVAADAIAGRIREAR
jgi:hypothetical protein